MKGAFFNTNFMSCAAIRKQHREYIGLSDATSLQNWTYLKESKYLAAKLVFTWSLELFGSKIYFYHLLGIYVNILYPFYRVIISQKFYVKILVFGNYWAKMNE